MSIGKKPVITFISIAAKSIARLAINKIFAVYLGTTGIAILAHFQNLIGMMTQLPNDGVNRGLSHLLQNKSDVHEIKRLTGSAFSFNLVLFLGVSIIIFLFKDFFFRFFIASVDKEAFYLIFFAAVMIFIINLFLQAFILSLKMALVYTLANILGIILLLILSYVGAKTMLIDHALLAFAIGQALSILVTLFIIFRYRSLVFGFTFSFTNYKKLSEFLLIVFSVLIFSKLVDFGVRHFAISEYGFMFTGLWQAVVKISDSYMSLFVATVGVVFYPQVSALVFDTDQLRKYIIDVLYIVAPVTLVGLLLIYIFRVSIINILFTPEFVPAQYLMKYQLIGDFFGIISYLLIYIVSAQARTSIFIALQIGSAILYLLLIGILTPVYKIEALPMAHAARFIIFFMVLVVLNRRILF